MNLGLSVAFVLLALTGTVKGSHLSDGSIDPRLEAAVHRARRWSGGRVSTPTRAPKPTRPSTGDDFSQPDVRPDNFGFNLDDALEPASQSTAAPSGGECQKNLIQKLTSVLENQNRQLRLLLQLTSGSRSRSPSAWRMR